MSLKKSTYWGWLLGIASLCGIIFDANCAIAQSKIIPDNTLGTEKSNVIPNFNGLSVEVISNGAIRGQNLFHSFQEFNVSLGRSAYFYSPSAAIQNIVARVTGSNRSEILGVLGTYGNSNSNLFLINPNGIVFGPNASLDVGGSFLATTANAIQFGNQGFFSASTPNIPSPLLTINPSALFFNQIPTGSIESRSANLLVPNGRSLSLVGGDISVDGGGQLRGLYALGGRVELGGLAEPGTVGLSFQGNEERLIYPEGVARADVSVTNRGAINVQADNGGSIAINAGNVNLTGRSLLFAGIGSSLATVNSQAGDIDINATKAVTLTGGSGIFNIVDPGTVGKTGNINITTGSLSLTSADSMNPTLLTIGILGQGHAGNIRIQASDSVHLDGSSGVQNQIVGGIGTGGNIEITTHDFLATNGSILVSSTSGRGNAGNIEIQADDVRFDTSSGAQSSVSQNAIGNGGNIEILAQSLSLTNGSGLATSTLGQGNAGNIMVQAIDNITLTNSRVVSNVGSIDKQPALGNVGNIDLSARTVSFTDGAQLQAGFYSGGQGNAGIVSVKARDSVSFSGMNSGILTNVESQAVGNGSDIQISGGSVSFTDGAVLEASNAGQGNAGNIIVHAQDNISVNNSLINSNIGSVQKQPAKGNVGNILIDARTVSFTDGAQLQAGFYSGGQGNAGIVSVKAKDTVSFAGTNSGRFPSGIFTNVESQAVGNGSDIQISAPLVSFTDGAVLEASNAGRGNGGNITITAGSLSFDQSSAFSTALKGSEGNAGSIDITARSLSVTNRGQLSTSSVGNGAAGNIKITTDQDIRLGNGASINANTTGGQGNIALRSGDLILYGNSNITTNATGNNVIGGNIIIDTDVLAAVENSDISANSADFRGGQVTINTNGIFRSSDSDISAAGANPQLNGIVQINTPEIDPSRGLVQLPTGIFDVSSKLVSSSCAAFADEGGSKFIVTGRGGLPPSPDEPLTSDVVWSDTRLPVTTAQQHSSVTSVVKQPLKSKTETVTILPATGWVFNNKGEVTLISTASHATGLGSTPAICPRR